MYLYIVINQLLRIIFHKTYRKKAILIVDLLGVSFTLLFWVPVPMRNEEKQKKSNRLIQF